MITSLKQVTIFEKRSRLFRLMKACWQSFKFRMCNFKMIVYCSLIFKNCINDARKISIFKSFRYWLQRTLICILCEFKPQNVRWKYFFSISEAEKIFESKFLRSQRLFKESIITEELKEVISIIF